jgi:hypothetical protein
MKESNESHPIYIIADSKKIAKCDWCGTTESMDWQKYRDKIYCSTDCLRAGQARNNLSVGLCLVVVLPCMWAVMTFPFVGIGFGLSIMMILLGCPYLIYGQEGRDIQKRITQGSKTQETPTELTLLRSVTSTVSCPKCDGNIDLTKVSEDMAYTCEYCGVSGAIEILQTDKD